MKTIILCGGIGYRLKEETEFKPKPMVMVGNKPILWHIMKIYSHYGFRDFILALGYKADYIKDYFLKQKNFVSDFTLYTKSNRIKCYDHEGIDDFKITFADTGARTLPGERILKLKKYLEKDDIFMATYGDGVADINIKKLIEFHRKQKTIGTITGVHPSTKYGLVKINKNNIVTAFEEKPVLSDWVNGGFMVFNKSVFKYFKRGETEHPALKRLAKKRELSLYIHDDFWHCMDTYRDVQDLNNLWKQNPAWKVWKSDKKKK